MLEALLQAVGHREAVQDHVEALRVAGERGDRVVVGGAGVDDERLAELAREPDVRARTRAPGRGAARSRGSRRGPSRRSRRSAGGAASSRSSSVSRRCSPWRCSGGGRRRTRPRRAPRRRPARRAALGVGADREDPRDAGRAARRATISASCPASSPDGCGCRSRARFGDSSVGGRAAREQLRDRRAGARAERAPARARASGRSRRARRAASPRSPACTGAAARVTARMPSASERSVDVELRRLRLVLGQLPRRALLDVAVEPPHALPDALERLA